MPPTGANPSTAAIATSKPAIALRMGSPSRKGAWSSSATGDASLRLDGRLAAAGHRAGPTGAGEVRTRRTPRMPLPGREADALSRTPPFGGLRTGPPRQARPRSASQCSRTPVRADKHFDPSQKAVVGKLPRAQRMRPDRRTTLPMPTATEAWPSLRPLPGERTVRPPSPVPPDQYSLATVAVMVFWTAVTGASA